MIRIIQIVVRAARNAPTAGFLLALLLTGARLPAACPGCTTYDSGIIWGVTTNDSVKEASGLAVSTRNRGVVWTHNDDGNDERLFAFCTNGAYLGRYKFNETPGLSLYDVEDMAAGPGPVAGLTYLYLGDIGGAGHANELRGSVQVLRIPEPAVFLTQSNNPVNVDLSGVEKFTLFYPESNADFDAETLMLDPVSGDLFVGTKQTTGTRLYRVNLNGATNNSTLLLEHVLTLPFGAASGGTISADGRHILIRREEVAAIWVRCEGETIGAALARPGTIVPVAATETNGEAVAFLPDGSGYLTVSDSTVRPSFSFFRRQCVATKITQQPLPLELTMGANAMFTAQVAGENLEYQWRFNGVDLDGANAATIFLADVQTTNSGQYSLRVVGNGGAATSNPAALSVRIFPPVLSALPLGTLAPTGSTVRLTVGVSGTPPFDYAWSFGQKLLNQDSSTLTLTNVTRKSSGKYHLVVTNLAGQATSPALKLTVLVPPTIALQPQPRTVLTGKTVFLRARASGSPKLAYQWLFNGAVLTNATKPQLTLTKVQPAQAGNYSVVVTNAVGTATSTAAVLTVQ